MMRLFLKIDSINPNLLSSAPLAVIGPPNCDSDCMTHRRRIITAEKAKVVASVWGEKFIQFLATDLPRMILNNRMN